MSRQNIPSPPTRPDMPPGYGLKPPSEGHLIQWEAVERKLQDAHNYWLVTASPDGTPHAAPLWGLWHAGSFFFGTDPESRKAVNFMRNSSVVVHLESGDDVVIVEGTVRQAVDEELLDELDKGYRSKYGYPLKGNPVYQVEITKALSWTESDFPESATKWQFEASSPSTDA